MEFLGSQLNEDISATMMRRARCLHAARYSTDAAANLQMLSGEKPAEVLFGEEDIGEINNGHGSAREELWRLWSWIERVEFFSSERDEAQANSAGDSEFPWPAFGLVDSGVLHLLRIRPGKRGTEQELEPGEVVNLSRSLGCDTYYSPRRRYVIPFFAERVFYIQSLYVC